MKPVLKLRMMSDMKNKSMRRSVTNVGSTCTCSNDVHATEHKTNQQRLERGDAILNVAGIAEQVSHKLQIRCDVRKEAVFDQQYISSMAPHR